MIEYISFGKKEVMLF